MERFARKIDNGTFTNEDSHDSVMEAGCGIMAKGDTFTCVKMEDSENEFKVLCTLNTDKGNLGPVTSIGNRYFRIGSQIFMFGTPDAVFSLPRNYSKRNVTRFIQDSNNESESIIMHASVCEPRYTRHSDYVYEGSVVIQHFKLNGHLAAKKVLKLENEDTFSTIVFWKNHLVVSNWNGPWAVISCMTGVVSSYYQPTVPGDQVWYSLKIINHGRELAIFYGKTKRFYDESQECNETEYEPTVRLLATFDIVNRMLVETYRPALTNAESESIIRKAFNISTSGRIWNEVFMYMPNILNMNRTMHRVMDDTCSVPGYMPTKDDEVLVYIPTCTVLPIRGSNKYKDITIIDSMVSANETYMVMLVTAKDGFDTRLQICSINLLNGRADNSTIACFGNFDTPVNAKLHGFISGNKAIMYSRTNADGIDSLMMQPIGNGAMNCMADELYETFGGSIPMEIVRRIVNFM